MSLKALNTIKEGKEEDNGQFLIALSDKVEVFIRYTYIPRNPSLKNKFIGQALIVLGVAFFWAGLIGMIFSGPISAIIGVKMAYVTIGAGLTLLSSFPTMGGGLFFSEKYERDKENIALEEFHHTKSYAQNFVGRN